jgi:hypothetical protein
MVVFGIGPNQISLGVSKVMSQVWLV